MKRMKEVLEALVKMAPALAVVATILSAILSFRKRLKTEADDKKSEAETEKIRVETAKANIDVKNSEIKTIEASLGLVAKLNADVNEMSLKMSAMRKEFEERINEEIAKRKAVERELEDIRRELEKYKNG